MPTITNTPIEKELSHDSIKTEFYGYNIDDRRYEVNGKEINFNSRNISIKCVYESHLYRNKYLTACMDAYNTQLYIGQIFNQTTGTFHNGTNLCHIHCQNGIRISLSLHQNEVASKLISFSMIWPNGLQITTHQYLTVDLRVISQSWTQQNCSEKSRQTYSNGCVVKYLHDDTVIVLTSNGTIYELFDKSRSTDRETATIDCDLEAENDKYCNETNFLNFLADNIQLDSFKFTTLTGDLYSVENGKIVCDFPLRIELALIYFISLL